MLQPAKFRSLRFQLFSALLFIQWLGVSGSLVLGRLPARAVATNLPEPTTVVPPSELEPTPDPVSPPAAAGDESVAQAAPAPEASPASPWAESEPPALEATIPEAIEILESPAAETPGPEPAITPTASPTEPEVVDIAPLTTEESADSTAEGSGYVDNTDYGLGATQAKPAADPPDQVVITERSTGCQAALEAGQGVPASLCASTPTQEPPSPNYPVAAPPPAPARTVYLGGVPNIFMSAGGRKPLQLAAQSNRSPEVPPAASVTFTGALSSASIPASSSYGSSYPAATVSSYSGGRQPFKWLVPKLSRLMFPLPFPVPITSAFGWRIHPISGLSSFHSGIDLGAETGTPILAADTGKVTIADWLGGYGLSVLLEHSEGQFATRYAHLSQVFVQPGQRVEKGTVIGLVGSTGNSTGPHLHYELLQRTPEGLVAVDPSQELKQALAQLVKALQTAEAKPLKRG